MQKLYDNLLLASFFSSSLFFFGGHKKEALLFDVQYMLVGKSWVRFESPFELSNKILD